MIKKIIFIFVLFIVLGFNFVLADSADIACKNYNYPWCGDKPKGIADLVGKFYGYALAAVGVAALGAIIYGGILHTVSAGNASQQSEARAWIWGAVTGVALLLGAYLLLNTINPELVKLKEPGITPVKIEKIKGGATTGNDTGTTYDYIVNTIINPMYNSIANCEKQGKSIYGERFSKSQFSNNICTITIKK